MALACCRECGRDGVSIDADACPGCGEPDPTSGYSSDLSGTELLVGVAAIAAGIFVVDQISKSQERRVDAERHRLENPTWSDQVTAHLQASADRAKARAQARMRARMDVAEVRMRTRADQVRRSGWTGSTAAS